VSRGTDAPLAKGKPPSGDLHNGDKYRTGETTPDSSPDQSIFSTEGDPVGIRVGTAIATLVRKAEHAPAGEVGFRHLWGQGKGLLETAEADARENRPHEAASIDIHTGGSAPVPVSDTARELGVHAVLFSRGRDSEDEVMESIVRRHRFTVEEYARMGVAGIFFEDDRVELIDGDVYEMTPIGPTHAGVVDDLAELLISRLAGKARVRIQNPIRLGRHTEPQPDLVVARLRAGRYTDRHPEGDDILLVIEVADSSLRYDREAKLPLYAEAGIPEAWLVDVAARSITVHTEPGAGGYAVEQTLKRGQEVVSSSVADLRLSVDRIFEGLR